MTVERVCSEHHVHDPECFADREQAKRKHLAWCLNQCEDGWPAVGWGGSPDTAPRQHARIKIDSTWQFCPLCGRQVR